MKFRRRSAVPSSEGPSEGSGDPSGDQPQGAVTGSGATDDAAGDAAGTGEPASTPAPALENPDTGPYDADELPEDDGLRVDLGSLLIGSEEGRELRLQVDDKSGNVQAIVLAGSDGAVEVRAFAAPRNGDLWTDVRPQIAADMVKRGGTATEAQGRFGDELHCEIKIPRKEGGAVKQVSRIVGINGPRWMLRVTFLGKPALEPDDAAEWEQTVTRIAVRRGEHAMAVGEALPVVMPDNARKVGPATDNPVAASDQASTSTPTSTPAQPQKPEQN